MIEQRTSNPLLARLRSEVKATASHLNEWPCGDNHTALMDEAADEIERLREGLTAVGAEQCPTCKGTGVVEINFDGHPCKVCKESGWVVMPQVETSHVTSMDYGGGPFDKDGNEGPNETPAATRCYHHCGLVSTPQGWHCADCQQYFTIRSTTENGIAPR